MVRHVGGDAHPSLGEGRLGLRNHVSQVSARLDQSVRTKNSFLCGSVAEVT
jgi:hypothetical protein